MHLSHMNSSTKHFATRSVVQRRPCIYNWNPWIPTGKEDAFEQQIAGRWHIITLQEASDYVDHELLTNRFHVTHYAGCAVSSNKDTHLLPQRRCQVRIYFHDTRRDLPAQVMEGEQGWVFPGVLSRAIMFVDHHSAARRLTVLSLHYCNVYAEKNGYCQETHPHSLYHHNFSRS